jgi:Mn2+/Fe2+ NRAMP family transporter
MRAARALGPGLLFTGAAVGMSLVQASRAAAGFGLVVALLVLLLSVVKYASFSFAPRYAASTGTSLLEGYRQQGIWALLVYAALTLGTMFTLEAVVVLVTAELLVGMLGLSLSPVVVSALLIGACLALIAIGRYRWLERLISIAVALLALLTLLAALLLLAHVNWSAAASWGSGRFDRHAFLFMLAVGGWMPAGLELSVWHSLWSLARRREGGSWSLRDALLDFDIGYLGTLLLALLLVVMGAGLVHGSGRGASPPSAGAYPELLVELFAGTVGGWSRPLIGTAGFLIMFATALTVVDGFPRSIAALLSRFAAEEDAGVEGEPRSDLIYWGAAAVIACGALAVQSRHLDRLGSLVDLATTLSIAGAPLLALLNHRAVTGAEVPAGSRPGPALRRWSWFSIAFLTLFALTYLYVRFFA